MSKKIMKLTYTSAFTDLHEINSSFDKAVLRIAYTGKNRNNSYISKDTFEKCIQTIYNCPIVCNYDRDSNSLGGHDVEIIRNSSDGFEFVNVTTPVGCIPESANIFWETVKEEDGTEHEYLCADALIWKRQEAYKKIKEDGFAAESMEITINDGKMLDGIYYIYDFEFTAFALIGVEPCFEGASINFNMAAFEEKLSQMKFDLEQSFRGVADTSGDIDKNLKGGGNKDLKRDFELDSNIRRSLQQALESVTVSDADGDTYPKYWLMDYDVEAGVIYLEDIEEGNTYTTDFSIENGTATIEFDSMARVELVWSPVGVGEKEEVLEDNSEGEFTEGKNPEDEEEDTEETADTENPENEGAEESETEDDKDEDEDEDKDLKAKYEDAIAKIEDLTAQVKQLGDYKLINELSFVFDEFPDLVDIEEFKLFYDKFMKGESDIDNENDLREACFAIRGRNCGMKFNFEHKNPKIKVPTIDSKDDDEPYGGLIKQYLNK